MRAPPSTETPQGRASGTTATRNSQLTQREFFELWNYNQEENMTTKAVILVGGPGKVCLF